MCGALLRRSRPNTNSPLLMLHTKDKSIRFCFKLLFLCAKNNKLYWITTTINFVNLWSQTSHISSGIIFRGEFDLITILTAVEYCILHSHIWLSAELKSVSQSLSPLYQNQIYPQWFLTSLGARRNATTSSLMWTTKLLASFPYGVCQGSEKRRLQSP